MGRENQKYQYYPQVVTPGKELNPEEDIKTYNSFFLNVVHSVPPRYPLFSYYCSRAWSRSMQHASEQLCIPGSKGIEYRHYRGALPKPIDRERRGRKEGAGS